MSSLKTASSLSDEIWPVLADHPDAALWSVGGGTTLDLSKLLRWRFANTKLALADWQSNTLNAQPERHDLWCSPTTAGTGSEVTPWATVWDLQVQPALKRSWYPPRGFPDKAWIDPLLTLSCPSTVTRDCGLDTLAHALESLWNRNASMFSRAIAIEAARTVLSTLPELMREPKSLALRSLMAHASLMAGLAISQTQTALAHALSYELTLQEKIPHGQACAVWLPMTLDIAASRSSQVRQDVESVFCQPLKQCVSSLREWLLAMDIECRDLRHTPAGLSTLNAALDSDRGRNFIDEAYS